MMKPGYWGWILLLLTASGVGAVVGDLNRDGKVDLVDFFLLADNFGREGEPPEECECSDSTGDDGPIGRTLDAIGDSTTLALASWNIRFFSTGSRDDTELPLIADRLQRFDLAEQGGKGLPASSGQAAIRPRYDRGRQPLAATGGRDADSVGRGDEVDAVTGRGA